MSAKLPIRMVEKPWGRDSLPQPFAAPAGERIGEVWFEPPAVLDQLLVKYIFTSEKLSVQVHPSDAQTQAGGLGRQGKEECWLVIDAQPGASLGIGFDAPISAAEMRAAALDGSIEQRLVWHPVRRGDFFYIPANTVHAIGAGVSLIEIQQNSDITYRLFDYGRPRELHLDGGIAVASGKPYHDSRQCRVAESGETVLVEGPLFQIARYDGPPSRALAERFGTAPLLVIPQSGTVFADGLPFLPGDCGWVDHLSALRVGVGDIGLIAQPLG